MFPPNGKSLVHDPLTVTPLIPTGLWYQAGPGTRVHPSAILEQKVVLGSNVAIWDNVHIRHDTTIGDECIIGEKTYIAYGVRIGHRCKINNMVSICTAVTIADGVMISAGTVFTNDRFPRATTPDLLHLRPSEPDETTLPTHVGEGATIGANCTIGNDLSIGRWAMIGMGSVVTRSIPDFALALGVPAQVVGIVCKCGQLLLKHEPGKPPAEKDLPCLTCQRSYKTIDGVTRDLDPSSP